MPRNKVGAGPLVSKNPFAILADPDCDRILAAARAREAARPKPQGYTVPKLDLFGADVPQSKSKEAVFDQALTSGYRAFDTASGYETIDALADVAARRGLGEALYVVYKVKPADDEALRVQARGKDPAERRQLMRGTVTAQLAKARRALGRGPDVLMLHELGSDRANERTLRQLARQVKAGQAKAIGVSNVGLDDLRRLQRRAKQIGCPIKAVENRFSPYHQDTEIRRFCEANNIRYMGYGLLGSTQTGACVGEGHGSPTQYLLPRRDPRLNALAEKHGVSAGELLLAWAYREEVVPVAFSSNGKRVADNFEARRSEEITEGMLEDVDDLFGPVSKAEMDAMARSERSSALKELFAAVPDRSTWFILETLLTDGPTRALLDREATLIAAQADLGGRRASLANFASNVLRHVADFQSSGIADWRGPLCAQLGEVARAAAHRPEVAERFSQWARKNAQVGGHFVDATAALPKMLAEPDSDELEVDLDDGWSAFTSADYDEVAEEPRAGQTLHFYHYNGEGAEMFAARVEARDGRRLTLSVLP